MASDDKMSSVSKSSRFSPKSQVIIDAQDKEIAKMKKLLAQAGIDPDQFLVPAGSSVSLVSETDAPRAASRAVQAQAKVNAQVRVQFARHVRYSLYVRAAKATKVVEVVDVTEQPRAVVSVKVSVKVSKGMDISSSSSSTTNQWSSLRSSGCRQRRSHSSRRRCQSRQSHQRCLGRQSCGGHQTASISISISFQSFAHCCYVSRRCQYQV